MWLESCLGGEAAEMIRGLGCMQAAYDTTKARKIWQRSVESSDPDRRVNKIETSIYRRKWEAVKQFELFFLDAYVGTI